MNGYISVANWQDFIYHKDGRPIHWIPCQLSLLNDYNFDQLPEIQQLYLLKIRLLAAKTENKIPNDEKWIGKKIGAESEIDIKSMIDKGFLCQYEDVQRPKTRPYELVPTEQNNTEQNNTHRSPRGGLRFGDWWKVYPKKVKRKQALALWNRKKLDDKADALIADVHNRLANHDRWKRGYIPDPTTYLNGERWDDEIEISKEPLIKLPADDNQLETFARQNDLSSPRPGENYFDYRRRLQREIDK